MIAIAPHHLIYTYLIIHKALRYCQNWCGLLLFYPQSRQCEKPEKKGKTNIVPTPYFFIRFLGGIKKAYLINEGGNLAASKIRNLECPSYEICLIDYGCGKFNRKIHIMEQYP